MVKDVVPQPLGDSWQECIDLLDRLPGLADDARLDAIEQLIRNPSPGIRSRALRMGAATLPDERIKTFLRSDADDVLRSAGVEMLKMRGNRGFHLTLKLLSDDDDDVALQAVIVLTHLRDPRALEPLRSVLQHDDPNIAQEALVAIGQIGDARAIPDVLPFLESDNWLRLAAVQALGNLRSPIAVPHLKRLLTDFMAGPMAVESLTRIGGLQAFRVVAEHWLRFRDEVDTETTLGFLAHLVEGLARAPAWPDGLRPALVTRLDDERDDVRAAAARCLLALGDDEHDGRALELVAEGHKETAVLPACLNHRKDLIGTLLAQPDVRRAWGFLLAARYPKAVPIEAVVAALERAPLPDHLDPTLRALDKLRQPEIGRALLGFYLRLPEEQRAAAHPLIQVHARSVATQLDDDDLEASTRVALKALLEEPPEEVRRELLELPRAARVRALHELLDLEAVLRDLPWKTWLDEDAEAHGPVAAEFAGRAGLHELAPVFRRLLAAKPEPYLVRILGELGDREAVTRLIELLTPSDPLEPLILESLGRIGGPEARTALRLAVASGRGPTERMAYRALALCATAEDDEIFRAATGHEDWYVRLSCADVLGRFSRPANLAALARLTSDPVPIVAQRALSYLED